MPYPHEKIPPELLDALLENPHESQILVDRDGIIRFISVHTEEFYEILQDEAFGRHILEMNPESLLPRVIATGKAEIGRVFRMGGKERIVARIPLRDREGHVVGAVGKLMFWHIKQVNELVRQVEWRRLWVNRRPFARPRPWRHRPRHRTCPLCRERRPPGRGRRMQAF